ncbi:MAG: hypothetical protein ACK415_05185 [Thermodesulfovibrionales bacterium]
MCDFLEKLKSKLKYVEENKNDYAKLLEFKRCIEEKGFQLRYWESYTKTKQYIKDIALKDEIEKENDKENDKERAFYDWLKICVNPQKEVNYDFYFEKNGLDKEEDVKKILFDKENNLKKIFKENEKKTDWQIRLRTIADWFLKRYDIATAVKIYKHIESPHKTFFDKVRLFIPRLIGAIFIGFLPLITGQETWELPLKLGWLWTILLSCLSLAFAYLYLTVECHNIIRKKKEALKRAFFVFFMGLLYSLVFSFVIVSIMGKHFIETQNFKAKCVDLMGIEIYFENIVFFASLALLIGIFIQVFWEEKTITEPL